MFHQQTGAPSDDATIEDETERIGKALLARMVSYRPSPAEAVVDQMMQVMAREPRFRAHLLRFVDGLAGMGEDARGARVQRLLQKYLHADFRHLPPWLQALIPIVRSPFWPSPLVAGGARVVARSVASRFIISGGPAGARAALGYLRSQRRCPSFDVLGEYVVSEEEAESYWDRYLQLLDVLAREPEAAVRLAPADIDLAAAVALPEVTFAATDIGESAARAMHQLLAAASSTSQSPHLKQLLTLADGPGLEAPGFLRRFALPKVVVVRTLHLGADLDL